MKKLFQFMAVIGLSVAGIATTTAVPTSAAQAQSWRDGGPRYDRDRRNWRDDRGRRGNDWRGRRQARVDRAYDRARRTPGYVDPRSQGDYTNYTGRGYRPCTYVRRNGRTVCR